MRNHFGRTSLGDRDVHKNSRSGFRLHSRIAKSEASVLVEFTNKSAMKLVVEPPATVGFGLCSAAIHDVSCDFIFTALELSALDRGWSGLPVNRTAQ